MRSAEKNYWVKEYCCSTTSVLNEDAIIDQAVIVMGLLCNNCIYNRCDNLPHIQSMAKSHRICVAFMVLTTQFVLLLIIMRCY